MSNTATQEMHFCARCKAVIEEESREVARAPKPLSLVPKPESDPPVAEASAATPISEAPASETRASETRIAAATEPAAVVAPVVAEERASSPKVDAAVADPLEEKDPFAMAAGPPTEKMKSAPMLAVEDSRDSPRRKLEVNVGIASDSHFFAGLSGDVPKGGLFVATYAELPLGGKVVLDFELPNGIIIVEGTVRWQRMATASAGPGIGIQFENVPRETMALIERFCKARPPLYYDQADDDF
ncbi:MAG: PilZ domain-containing protein [Polyangiaceae bacterium]